MAPIEKLLDLCSFEAIIEEFMMKKQWNSKSWKFKDPFQSVLQFGHGFGAGMAQFFSINKSPLLRLHFSVPILAI
jgi:hypothetical protein